MIANYKSYLIEYDYIYNYQHKTIVFLHGWGGDKNSFKFLFPYLDNFNLLAISFPPYFLKTNYHESVIPLTMEDYLNILLGILRLHNISSVFVICHSFGFRICLMLATTNIKISAIIVTGGAGIDIPKKIIKKLKTNSKIIWNKKFKIIDKKLDINLLKNTDKTTFKYIINKNLFFYKILISCPVMLFWGQKDSATPIKCAKILHKTFKHSTLIATPGDHFTYLKFQNQFTKATLNFLKERV